MANREAGRSGRRQVRRSRAITVGQYLDEWLGSLGMAQLEGATVSWYRSAVLRHISPTLGKVRLSRLTPTMIEAFMADKAKNGRLEGSGGLGPTSVRRLQVTFGHMHSIVT